MRCYLHAFLLCALVVLFSPPCVLVQVERAEPGEPEPEPREQAAAHKSGRDPGGAVRKTRGAAGLGDLGGLDR